LSQKDLINFLVPQEAAAKVDRDSFWRSMVREAAFRNLFHLLEDNGKRQSQGWEKRRKRKPGLSAFSAPFREGKITQMGWVQGKYNIAG